MVGSTTAQARMDDSPSLAPAVSSKETFIKMTWVSDREALYIGKLSVSSTIVRSFKRDQLKSCSLR